jgi:peptidoglycan/xylan/chitin deacetylase (PgdA/CDA1 family)
MRKDPIWPQGKRGAVSLTYDDALECHWQEVAPALEQRGFRGTFYTPIRESLWQHAARWRKVAESGHELGNHTIFHPCRRPSGTKTDRDDLRAYSLEDLQRELEVANAFLHLIDGKELRTYGNTCHHNTVGSEGAEVPMEPLLASMFSAARGPRHMAPISMNPETLDLHKVGCVSSHQFSVLKQGIEHAAETGGWIIICLHGVAEHEERLRIARSEHEALLDHLAGRSEIWVSPVTEIAETLRKSRALEHGHS